MIRRGRCASLASGLVGLGLVATACSSMDPATLGPPGLGETPVVGAPPTTMATTTTTVVLPHQARALITPTGVVVAVTGHAGGTYEVIAPCGGPALVGGGRPVAQVDIVLDPGHGGPVETGAVGPNGLVERDLNLALAERAVIALETMGISVLMTRTDDYQVPLAQRAGLANRLEAKAIISLHHNGPQASPATSPGTEVYVQHDRPESRRLGGTVYEAVTESLSAFDVAWQAAPDAGVLAVVLDDGRDSYGMIRRPEIPAVLIEFGYLANPAEAELFATDAYLDAASAALAAGIEAWLHSEAEGTGFVDEPRVFTPSGLTGGDRGCVDPPLE